MTFETLQYSRVLSARKKDPEKYVSSIDMRSMNTALEKEFTFVRALLTLFNMNQLFRFHHITHLKILQVRHYDHCGF